jgi:hypothetical protein
MLQPSFWCLRHLLYSVRTSPYIFRCIHTFACSVLNPLAAFTFFGIHYVVCMAACAIFVVVICVVDCSVIYPLAAFILQPYIAALLHSVYMDAGGSYVAWPLHHLAFMLRSSYRRLWYHLPHCGIYIVTFFLSLAAFILLNSYCHLQYYIHPPCGIYTVAFILSQKCQDKISINYIRYIVH